MRQVLPKQEERWTGLRILRWGPGTWRRLPTFIKNVFGLSETERRYGDVNKNEELKFYRLEEGDIPPPDEVCYQIYLSDGNMNLTIQHYLRTGMAHFGFVADDVDKTMERLAATEVQQDPELRHGTGAGTFRPVGRQRPASFRQRQEFKIQCPQDVVVDLAAAGPTSLPGFGWSKHARGGFRAKFQHIAVGTPDMEKTANFYKGVFGLYEVYREPEGSAPPEMVQRVDLSDTYINLAVCKVSALGLHHFGFVVADMDETVTRLEAAGATCINQQKCHGTEVTYNGPEGVIIDLSERGWSH